MLDSIDEIEEAVRQGGKKEGRKSSEPMRGGCLTPIANGIEHLSAHALDEQNMRLGRTTTRTVADKDEGSINTR